MKGKKIIGYYGYPPRDITDDYREAFPNHEWVDLDVDLKNPDSGILPKSYCRIIRNIVDNAISLKDKLEVVIGSIGAEKCEGGRYAAFLLAKSGFNVVMTMNDDTEYIEDPSSLKVPISRSDLPLVEKVEKIMSTVLSEYAFKPKSVKPTHGFWGVPPHDFELLKMFPDTTHVYGWTRCVEAGRPSDLNLECYVDEGVPTVFFTQNFCAKSQLAKWLAEKYGGLFIDADGAIGAGIRARIEAFLKLSGSK